MGKSAPENMHICVIVWQSKKNILFMPKSAKGADLTLAAAPFAASVGQTHHHIPTFAVSFAKSLQDLVSDEGACGSAEHSLLVVSGHKAKIFVPLEETLHHKVLF